MSCVCTITNEIVHIGFALRTSIVEWMHAICIFALRTPIMEWMHDICITYLQ